MEGRLGPRLLRVVRVRDFLGYFGGRVGDDSVEVVCRGGVVRGDVFTALEGYRGEEAVSAEVRLEPRLWQLLRCPGIFDLLSFRRGKHTRRV